jgi:hypothetical protein
MPIFFNKASSFYGHRWETSYKTQKVWVTTCDDGFENLFFPFNFVLAVEILMRPTLNTYQFAISEETSQCCH